MPAFFFARPSIPFTVPKWSSLHYLLDVVFLTLFALAPTLAQGAGIRDVVIPAKANQPEFWPSFGHPAPRRHNP